MQHKLFIHVNLKNINLNAYTNINIYLGIIIIIPHCAIAINVILNSQNEYEKKKK